MRKTKTDENGHLQTPALSAPQVAAVELVALGRNDTDTAEVVGVARQTVNGWRHHDPAFIAALNVRRMEIWEDTHDRIRGMATRACDVLAGALDGPVETSLPAAVHVLKALKVYGNVEAPNGPTSALAVIAVRARANAEVAVAGLCPDTEPIMEAILRPAKIARLAGEEYDRLMEELRSRQTIET
jgi:hypothetical protein